MFSSYVSGRVYRITALLLAPCTRKFCPYKKGFSSEKHGIGSLVYLIISVGAYNDFVRPHYFKIVVVKIFSYRFFNKRSRKGVMAGLGR